MKDNVDELLMWVEALGDWLLVDDYKDIGNTDHLHHWLIGVMLVLAVRSGEVYKSLLEASKVLNEAEDE